LHCIRIRRAHIETPLRASRDESFFDYGPCFFCHSAKQTPDRSDILNVAGFSDAIFSVVVSFPSDDAEGFVAEVETVEL
jgi:hypothetical protein